MQDEGICDPSNSSSFDLLDPDLVIGHPPYRELGTTTVMARYVGKLKPAHGVKLDMAADTLVNIEIIGPDDEEWEFWRHEAKLWCMPYNEQIDRDALAVLKAICRGRYNSDIAAELGLPPQYVELLQCIFCSVGWCEYGTSPRGCWIDHEHNPDDLVTKFEDYMWREWVREPDDLRSNCRV